MCQLHLQTLQRSRVLIYKTKWYFNSVVIKSHTAVKSHITGLKNTAKISIFQAK